MREEELAELRMGMSGRFAVRCQVESRLWIGLAAEDIFEMAGRDAEIPPDHVLGLEICAFLERKAGRLRCPRH